ncbi:HDOD domain-containing protein [Sulfurimonas sp.]
MTYETIIKKIDDMPPLSDVARNLQALYSKGVDNVDIRKLVKMIEADVMLTTNILKQINSPFYGFSNKITSISHAVTLFGVTRINSFVLHYAMSKQLKVDTEIYGFNNEQFNEMCILQSSLMMQWYARVDLRDTHILSSLALIMEAGKIIIAKELYASDYLQEYRKGFLACTNIQEYEREFLGTTSYYLSSVLFRHWHLEPVYIAILEVLDADDETRKKYDAKILMMADAIDVIRTAINLKEVLTDDSIKKASKIVKKMGLPVESFEQVAYRVKKAYENE